MYWNWKYYEYYSNVFYFTVRILLNMFLVTRKENKYVK